MRIGYARVSTEDQDLGRQVSALEKAGCEVVYCDKMSGAKGVRPELGKMMERLKEGDCVVIQKLDRLGRSLLHLIDLVDEFKAKGVEFVSLGDNFDTSTPQGRFLFHVIAAVAEFERELIRERVKDGMRHAREQGKRVGRPGMDMEGIRAAVGLGVRVSEVAKNFGVSRVSVYKALKKG